MARGLTLNSFIRAATREIARQNRLRQAEARRLERGRIQAQKAYLRAQAEAQRDAKAAYLESRVDEVAAKTRA